MKRSLAARTISGGGSRYSRRSSWVTQANKVPNATPISSSTPL
jgi:hypothetical protein